MTRLKQRIFSKAPGAVFALSVFLGACGGGAVTSVLLSGIGGTGIVFGTITGFGSVHVNGDRFETDTSQFIVDGNTGADQSDLALGMVVKLKVETKDGVYTGKALEVVYDDEIEGPVLTVSLPVGATRTLNVFGQTITIDEIGTLFEDTSTTPDLNFGFATIVANDVVEVSGFRVSATEINATYVEKTDDLNPGVTEVELRGPIKNLGGVPPNETFQVDGTNIAANLTTQLDVPNGVLVEDLYVEVEGVIQANQSVIADKIEAEDEDFDDDVEDISLQGVVSGYVDIDTDFIIDTQLVNASRAQFKPSGAAILFANPLTANGLKVEVEGAIVGGKLIADEVEVREGDTELRTKVNDVEPGDTVFRVNYSPLVGTVIVRTDGQTLFKDETGAVLTNPPFSVDDLMATDFVRVEGREVNGEVIASTVRRTDGTGRDLKLKGAVDEHVDNISITILGIQYLVDPTMGTGTNFENFPDSAAFFDVMNDGNIVEIEDDFAPDGTADNVELE